MTLEEFYTYQEQTFDSFCKAVIRNESIDAFRELAHRREHEIEFSALPPKELASLQAEDPHDSYKKLSGSMGNRIPYAIIVTAKSGDAEAMSKILRHYERYIIVHSIRVLYDEHGNHYEVLDNELRQRIEAKLIFQIISKFDHTKEPSGEAIER